MPHSSLMRKIQKIYLMNNSNSSSTPKIKEGKKNKEKIVDQGWHLMIHLFVPLNKGVTMRAIFSNPAGWKFIDSLDDRKLNF